MIERRQFLRGLIAAPAVIAAERLMPVRSILRPSPGFLEVVIARAQADIDRAIWDTDCTAWILPAGYQFISNGALYEFSETGAHRMISEPPVPAVISWSDPL